MKAVLFAALSSTVVAREFISDDDSVAPTEFLSEKEKAEKAHNKAVVGMEKKMARKNVKVYGGEYIKKYASGFLPAGVNIMDKIKDDMNHQKDEESSSKNDSSVVNTSSLDKKALDVKNSKSVEELMMVETARMRAPVELERQTPAVDHSDANADLLNLDLMEANHQIALAEAQADADWNAIVMNGAAAEELTLDCDVVFDDFFASLTALDQCLFDKIVSFTIISDYI
jgi:hypothetical protein